jgi:hypothetical protein
MLLTFSQIVICKCKQKKQPVVLSFKEQLDSQKTLLRKQQFNPISDAYLQTHARQS